MEFIVECLTNWNYDLNILKISTLIRSHYIHIYIHSFIIIELNAY